MGLMADSTVMGYITAPAPAFILRLFEIRRLIEGCGVFAQDALDVAELGPGLGDVAAWLLSSPLTRSMTLIETSLPAQELLRERFLGDPRVSLADSPAAGSYGLFLAFEVLEHIEDDQRVLRQVAASLAPGGWLIGSVPAFMRKWQAADEFAGHFRRYERAELEEKLTSAGFSDISLQVYGFPVTNLLYPLRQPYYRRAMGGAGGGRSRQEATDQSGISRVAVRRLNKALVFRTLRMVDPLQRMPGIRGLGSDFIFAARKV